MVSWLTRALKRGATFQVGELTIRIDGGSWTLAGPASAGESREVEPVALRDITRFDEGGRYRPLTGARSLPSGWKATLPDGPALLAAIEEVYPLAVAHIESASAKTLRLVPLDDVLARQSGRYASSAGLPQDARETAVEVVCGGCARTPAWDGQTTDEEGVIPCPEACSVLVAFCREAERWEQEPPDAAAVDDSVGSADFETPGNALREAYLRHRR